MGVIEISDGVTNRRIPVREFIGTIRVETHRETPRVVIPPDVTVIRMDDGSGHSSSGREPTTSPPEQA